MRKCASSPITARKVPIVVGYLVQGTGSFAAALVFVSANALIAIVCYLFVVGKIQRFEFKPGA